MKKPSTTDRMKRQDVFDFIIEAQCRPQLEELLEEDDSVFEVAKELGASMAQSLKDIIDAEEDAWDSLDDWHLQQSLDS